MDNPLFSIIVAPYNNGKTALLSAEKDVIVIATNIEILAYNRSLAKELGEAGRKHIRENYSMEKYLNKILNCIK